MYMVTIFDGPFSPACDHPIRGTYTPANSLEALLFPLCTAGGNRDRT